MNKFVFVACHFNMSQYTEQMILSLMGQNYPRENWRLLITDDMSSVEHQQKLQDLVLKFKENFNCNIELILNEEKKWETENVLRMIAKCDDEEIICRIDCDDFLSEMNALNYLNQVYEKNSAECVWSAHSWNGDMSRNISGQLPTNADVYQFPWVSSHLKTFRKKLINNISDANFRNQNGEYIKRCGDQAIYLPVLHKSNFKKRFFLPLCLYHYRIDEQGGKVYQSDDAKFQKQEAEFLKFQGFIETGKSWEDILNGK